MTNRELISTCRTTESCVECPARKECDAFREKYDVTPETIRENLIGEKFRRLVVVEYTLDENWLDSEVNENG